MRPSTSCNRTFPPSLTSTHSASRQSRTFAGPSREPMAAEVGPRGSAAVAAAVQVHLHCTMAQVRISRSNAILARVSA